MDIQTKIKLLKTTIDGLNDNHDVDAYLKHVCRVDDLINLIRTLDHRDRVLFAFQVAKSVRCFIKDAEILKKFDHCLGLLDKWLNNPKSVFNKDMCTASADLRRIVIGVKAIRLPVCAAVYAGAYAVDVVRDAPGRGGVGDRVSITYAYYVVCNTIDANPNKNQQKLINLKILAELL